MASSVLKIRKNDVKTHLLNKIKIIFGIFFIPKGPKRSLGNVLLENFNIFYFFFMLFKYFKKVNL